MITLTAIIRCNPGSQDHIRQALLAVGRHASESELGTVGYFITEDGGAALFVTHERYVDQAALDAHNDGAGAKGFFAAADGHIASVDIHIGSELFAGGNAVATR